MAPLIDEISKKVTSAGQKTAKAITDMSQVSRLRDAINTEQKNIGKLHVQIGQIISERYADTVIDPAVTQLCYSIRESSVRISQLEDEIRGIQNVKSCPQCGSTCGYTSVFCPQCGYAFPKVQNVQTSSARFCTNCGASLAEGAIFCTECGQPVQVAPAGSAHTAEFVSTPEFVAAPTPDSPPKPAPAQVKEADEPADAGEVKEEASVDESADADEVKEEASVDESADTGDVNEQALADTVETKSEVAADEPTVQPDQSDGSDEDVRHCENCGAALMDGAVFCVECGAGAEKNTDDK